MVAALALAGAVQVVRSAVVQQLVASRPEVAAKVWPAHPRVGLALAMAEIGAGREQGAGAVRGEHRAKQARGAARAARGRAVADPGRDRAERASARRSPSNCSSKRRAAIRDRRRRAISSPSSIWRRDARRRPAPRVGAGQAGVRGIRRRWCRRSRNMPSRRGDADAAQNVRWRSRVARRRSVRTGARRRQLSA